MSALKSIETGQRIALAASWRNEKEAVFSDNMYAAFVKVMEHRRKTAREYLQEKDEQKRMKILLVFDDCNEKLKEILGLP